MMGIQQECKKVFLTASLITHFVFTKKKNHVTKLIVILLMIFRCWISDAVLHKWVNISYYGVVFIFTITIFIITVWQIIVLKPTAVKSPDGSTTAYSFSIVSLFVQLGITWAFAFFSHGPMVIASYYIFTILNSFQGRLQTDTQKFLKSLRMMQCL